jgi:uncharacterized repeat protein (TIGR03803 family)
MQHRTSAAQAALRSLAAGALAVSPVIALLSGPAPSAAATVRAIASITGTFPEREAIHGRAHHDSMVLGTFSLPATGAMGINPAGNVVDDGTGTLYASMSGGGAYSQGALFKIKDTFQSNTASVAYSFGQFSPDGSAPSATPLILGSWVYGATSLGGNLNFGGSWRIKTNGFSYGWSDLSPANIGQPSGKLLHKGSLNWGVSQNGGNGFGTLYSVTANGNANICYKFSGPDGSQPVGNIIYWNNAFYGVTTQGGANGVGVVFKINASCHLVWTHSFGTGNDGASPAGGLLRIGNRIYGTTAYGGQYQAGTIFNIGATGSEQAVSPFKASGNIGTNPSGDLLYITTNPPELYGTTMGGGGTSCTTAGVTGCGTIYTYKLPASPTSYSTQHSFQGGTEGQNPAGGVMLEDITINGFYGTTLYGGTGQAGTIWAWTCPSCQ